MAAIRDRQSDLADEPAETAWDDRPIFGSSQGLNWWVAVVLAGGLALVAAVIDLQRQDSLGRIYQGAYVLGCLAAICWVRRRSLFGPMVQPPLVFAATAITAVVLFGPDSSGGGGLKQLLFSVALPLTSNFPTMAITTALAVGIGLLRLFLQRDPNPQVGPSRSALGRGMADPAAERGRQAERSPRVGEPDRRPDPRDRRGRPAPDRNNDLGGGARPERGTGRPGRDRRADGAVPPRQQRGARQPDPQRRRQGAPEGQRRDERGTRDRRDSFGPPELPSRPVRRRPPEDRYR